jgi:hypothetical protein
VIRAAAAALLLHAAGAAPAAEAGGWSLSLAAESLHLEERGPDGRRLVREQGPLAGVRLRHTREAGERPGWRAGLQVAAGRVDYDGRTQGGAPASSTTRSQIAAAEVVLAWPLTGAVTAEGGLAVEHFRRRIAGVGPAIGLDERLLQPRVQLGLARSDGPWTLRAGASHGERAPLEVRFDGGAFDRATLRSGRASGLSVEAGRVLAPGWQLSAGVERLAVGRSLEAALRRDGAVVGRVQQPAWTRQRLWLAVAWSGG